MLRLKFLLLVVKTFGLGTLVRIDPVTNEAIKYPDLTIINNSNDKAVVTYRGKTYDIGRYRTMEISE